MKIIDPITDTRGLFWNQLCNEYKLAEAAGWKLRGIATTNTTIKKVSHSLASFTLITS